MKKLMALLLAMAMVFAFAACGDDSATPETTKPEATDPTQPEGTDPTDPADPAVPQTVTVYIPASIAIEYPDGTVYGPAEMVYEENWQTKDSFLTSYSIEIAGMKLENKITYGNKSAKTETSGVQVETVIDENGRTVKQTSYGAIGTGMEKSETVYVYDAQGRLIKETTTTKYTSVETLEEHVTEYVITETADGSEGRAVMGNATIIYVYDKQFRQVATITIVDGVETSKVEMTYDEAGNLVNQKTYNMGTLQTTITYTYKTAEISAEKAEQLPQFVRVK